MSKPTKQIVTCVQTATKILGDKWTPILLGVLANQQAVRFCELQTFANGINPRTLSARLQTLEEHGIIDKQPIGSNRYDYQLTPKGRDLLPVLRDMEKWGNKYSSDISQHSAV